MTWLEGPNEEDGTKERVQELEPNCNQSKFGINPGSEIQRVWCDSERNDMIH